MSMRKLVLAVITSAIASACSSEVNLELGLDPVNESDDPTGSVGPFGWARLLPGLGDGVAATVYWDEQDSLIVGGSFNTFQFADGSSEGSIDLGAGPVTTSKFGGQGYVARYSAADGSPVWLRPFDGEDPPDVLASSAVADVVTDGTGRVLAAGSFTGVVDFGSGPMASADCGDGFVARYQADGAPLGTWVIPGMAIMAIAPLADGGVVATGYQLTSDCPAIGSSQEALFEGALVRLDAAGQVVWRRLLGQSASVTNVAAATDGVLAIAGNFRDGVDVAGIQLEAEAPLVAQSFVAVVSGDGDGVWARAFLAASEATRVAIEGLALGDGDRILATGSFAGTVDFGEGPIESTQPKIADLILVEIEPLGESLEATTFGDGIAAMRGISIDAAEDGELEISGTIGYPGLDIGGADPLFGPFAARFDGSELRAIQGMSSAGLGEGLALDLAGGPGGQIAVAGRFSGFADFGGGGVETGYRPVDVVEQRETDGFISVYRAASVIDSRQEETPTR